MRRSSREDISTRLQRIAELSREDRSRVLTTLAHHIDVEFLREAYRRTRKSGAVGVDDQTAAEYAENLEENLESLLNRFKSGRYRAPPVRRSHIPKGTGRGTRPIGIPTFEDKVLQRAVTMVLEAVYEQEFLDCSWGFRPNRSAHQALETLWQSMMQTQGGWVLEADIESFFDTLVPHHLRSFLDCRVRDGVLRRMVDKWLKAGVMEEGSVRYERLGTPQGGVISPLLANVYLHEVLDRWISEQVRPRLVGAVLLVRYADDFVLVFTNLQDAQRVLEVLPKRLARFGLRLHPDKTRLVPFQRPRKGRQVPGIFDLLGFTHMWAKSRRGNWVIRRKTAKDRMARSVHRMSRWCRWMRHWKVRDQHAALVRSLRGHYGYYGITGNYRSLAAYRRSVLRLWRKWLSRRSQRSRIGQERFQLLLERYPLPDPRIYHSALRA